VPCLLPDVTTDSAPFENGGNSKDVNVAYDTKRQRLIMGTGDFSSTYANDSGNQSIFAYDPTANAWTTISPYCHPPGQITLNHPTDRGPFFYDLKRDALWVWNPIALPDQAGQVCTGPPPGSGSIYTNGLLRLDLGTGVWQQMSTAPTFSVGGAHYDSAADASIHIEPDTACPSRIVQTDLTTLQQTSTPFCNAPSPQLSASGGWQTAEYAERAFFAWDDARRLAYIAAVHRRYDAQGNVVESATALYRFDAATRGITALALAPVRPGIALDPYALRIVFDAVHNRVLYPVVSDPCGVVQQMLVYDPATNTWEHIPLPAADIRGNAIGFDPVRNVMVLAGSVFCEDRPQQTHLFLYRYRD